jgi:hypothetical protein
MATVPGDMRELPKNSIPLFYRAAFARARPCYCYGCICLTRDERAYERRVFRLVRAWRRRARRAQPEPA